VSDGRQLLYGRDSARIFDGHRAPLISVAYCILGSVIDAEDTVLGACPRGVRRARQDHPSRGQPREADRHPRYRDPVTLVTQRKNYQLLPHVTRGRRCCVWKIRVRNSGQEGAA
jgi:hypothetical protein